MANRAALPVSALVWTLLIVLPAISLAPPTASAGTPLCKDDIVIKEAQIQAVQVVWQDDPDYPVHGNTSIKVDGTTTLANTRLVEGKATLLFGTWEDYDGDPYTINLPGITNFYAAAKGVKVRFRLLGPAGENLGDIYISNQTYNLPAATPDPYSSCNIPGMYSVSLKSPLPPDLPFFPHGAGAYSIEVEVVNPDGTRIMDANPANQYGVHFFFLAKTHPLRLLFVPIGFQNSTYPDTIFEGPGSLRVQAGDSRRYIRGTFPVADEDVTGHYNALSTDLMARNISIRSTDEWKNLPSWFRRDNSLPTMALGASMSAWSGGHDRIVLMLDPDIIVPLGYLGLQYQNTKQVAFVTWGAGNATPWLVAHEVGHSYGLWTGETEEYYSGVANNQGGYGRVASGYWVNERIPFNKVKCLMGKAPVDTNGNPLEGVSGYIWSQRWIDKEDYRNLLGRFTDWRDPEVLGVRAVLYANGTAEPLPWSLMTGDADLNGTENGTHSIVLRDAAGRETGRFNFTPSFEMRVEGPSMGDASVVIAGAAPVAYRVPWDPGAARVELWNGSSLLTARNISASPPAVSITSPSAGEKVGASGVAVAWNGSDPDDDALSYTVLASADGGGNWSAIAVDRGGSGLLWNASGWPEGDAYRLRIVAGDGIRTSVKEVGPFTVTRSLFTLAAAPSGGALAPGEVINLTVRADSKGGFNGTLSLSASSDAPAGALDISFPSGAAATLSAGGSVTVPLSVRAAGTAAGGWTLTVTVTGGGLVSRLLLPVAVRGGPGGSTAGNVTVTPGHPPSRFAPGPAANWDFTLQPQNGFAGNVSVSVSVSPAHPGITVVPATANISLPGAGPNGTGPFTVEVRRGNGVPAGKYNLSVRFDWENGSLERVTVLTVDKTGAQPRRTGPLPSAPAWAMVTAFAVLALLSSSAGPGHRRRPRRPPPHARPPARRT